MPRLIVCLGIIFAPSHSEMFAFDFSTVFELFPFGAGGSKEVFLGSFITGKFLLLRGHLDFRKLGIR